MENNNVEFDVDKMKYDQAGANHGNQPAMISWLMKKGIVKSPGSANAVLVGVVIANVIIILIVVSYLV
ncbi:MAG: hypothetical protein M3Q80_00095 [bacterium]|nr:hypothetical protein [bacterium]